MLFELTKTLVNDVQNALNEYGEKGLPRNQIQTLVQRAVEKCNLVSREEFDAQTAVLRKTREQLHELEEQLKQLQSEREAN